MKEIQVPQVIAQPVEARRAIKKSKKPLKSEKNTLDSEYPVDDIILKCMKIQKLLEKSSQTIRRFSREIRSLNSEMDQIFRPVVQQPVVPEGNSDSEFYLLDHRAIFGKLLEYSDVSDAEEPDECNTSTRAYSGAKRHRRAGRTTPARREEHLNLNELKTVFMEEIQGQANCGSVSGL